MSAESGGFLPLVIYLLTGTAVTTVSQAISNKVNIYEAYLVFGQYALCVCSVMKALACDFRVVLVCSILPMTLFKPWRASSTSVLWQSALQTPPSELDLLQMTDLPANPAYQQTELRSGS